MSKEVILRALLSEPDPVSEFIRIRNATGRKLHQIEKEEKATVRALLADVFYALSEPV